MLSYYWESITPKICPICNGVQSFYASDDGLQYYCLCATLKWLDRRHQEAEEWETRVAPAKLSDLVPLAIPDETAAKDLRKTLEVVRSFLDFPDFWMLLQGDTGCGKSHILRSIKTALPWLVTYISAESLQSKLFSALGSGRVDEFRRVLELAPVLLIDDLGIEHKSSFTLDTIAGVINVRYSNHIEKPTVVATNLSFGDLTASPDIALRRVGSRLVDTKISKYLPLTQDDFRNPSVQMRMRKSVR